MVVVMKETRGGKCKDLSPEIVMIVYGSILAYDLDGGLVLRIVEQDDLFAETVTVQVLLEFKSAQFINEPRFHEFGPVPRKEVRKKEYERDREQQRQTNGKNNLPSPVFRQR
jgi:hypothetical protein